MPDGILSFEEWLWEKFGLDIDHEMQLGTIPDHAITAWKERYQEYLDKNSPHGNADH